ncbi:MAG: PorV/PorQ family protein [Fibrobacterota bacterium]
MRNPFLLRTALLVLVPAVALFAVGQAALPTLLLAPGARATGMGEAFVAVSDDVDATYYNPGALGLTPLANSWKTFLPARGETFVAIGAKPKLFFAERPAIWAATEKGLYKFDGNNWLDYEIFYLEQNDNIEKVVRKYLNFADSATQDDLLKKAVDTVKAYNKIVKKADEEGLPDFKMPFFTALQGEKITALFADDAGKLWVGTENGLFHYNGSKWKKYNDLDGLPANAIRCISAGGEEVWVGTHRGAARLSGGRWRLFSTDSLMQSDTITALDATQGGGTVWIGTTNGLIRKKGKTLSVFDSTNGLIDNYVKGIAADNDRNVWCATRQGVARYKLKAWKKFKFDDNEVQSITVDSRDLVWVGTRKGALRYTKGRVKVGKEGRSVEGAEWKHFHSQNGLPSDRVLQVLPQARDVWFLTDKGISRYDKSERQIGAFWENLLPEFGLKDLYHLYFSTTWPTEDWGTLGAFVKYISFGENEWTDEVGRHLGTFRSFDFFAGLSYGTNFGDNTGIGITPKFIYSKLADVQVGNEKRRGIASSFAVDFGLKQRNIVRGLDFGLTLQNMGPDIVYIDQNQADPIPFNLRTGVAWRALDNPIHNLKVLFDVNRELIRRRDDDQTVQREGKALPPDPFWKAAVTTFLDDPWREEIAEFIYSLGAEYWYSHFLAFRVGTMYDKAGSRGEITFGMGINYGNIHFNGSYIVGSPFVDRYIIKDHLPGPTFDDEGSARNKQLRLSLIFMY